MPGRLEVREVAEGQIRFQWAAGQRQVILTGELCTSPVNARNNRCYGRHESPPGDLYFVLRTADGQLPGNNPIYAPRSVMENGIQLVRANTPSAPLLTAVT